MRSETQLRLVQDQEQRQDAAKDAAKSSNNRNNSDTSVASNSSSNKSTITFEKQKVVPRARTHSIQSVLSSISLRSMINHNNSHTATVNNVNSNGNNTVEEDAAANNATGFPNITQQIQSPAMACTMVKRRTRASNTSMGNLVHNNRSDTSIGQKLPFTDDRRSNPATATTVTANDILNGNANNVTITTISKQLTAPPSPLSECSFDGEEDGNRGDGDEDDAAQQKRLTTDALRKLSMLTHNKSSIFNAPTPLTSNENLVQESLNPLTQIQFGGKNIILDSSIMARRHTQVPSLQQQTRKKSLDVISQPNSSMSVPTVLTSKIKRPIKQINNPKKPMYTPAVLRDIAETNITNDVLRTHSPVPSLNTQLSNQGTITNAHTTASSSSAYAASVHSTSSSIISEYGRKIGSWLSGNVHHSSSSYHGPTVGVDVIPPTRSHWVSDSKRQSCKYCHKLFTFWDRKHHCRHCGDIFCQQHVRHWLYLDSQAKFVIGGSGVGVLSKICDGCLEEYERVVREGPSSATSNNDATSSTENLQNLGNSHTTCRAEDFTNGIDTTLSSEPNQDPGKKRERLDSVVGSVPADWNWSSF